MEKNIYNQILVYLLIALSVTQVLNLCNVFFSQFVDWTIAFGIIIFTYVKMYIDKYAITIQNVPILIYALWLVIGIVRGIYTAETYWETKFLVTNSLCLSIPIFALLFRKPSFTLSFFQKWNKILPVYLFLFIIGFIPVYWFHFCMGPVYFLLGALWFIIPGYKWKLIILAFIFLMFAQLDARSQVLKGIITIIIAFAVLVDQWIPRKLLQFGSLSFYLFAILLLYLGITGKYNIFNQSDKSAPDTYINGKLIEKPDIVADTRTAIYIEVITSAINNDYIWAGRTPARGNDSQIYKSIADVLGPNAKPERNSNEVCFTNVFTWLGLIGVILYTILYLQATILGSFFSRNRYIRYLAIIVGAHWMLCWIEDINSFNFMNVGLWMIIGMCISPEFRKMSNTEFKIWFISLFDMKNVVTPYHKYNMLRTYLTYKLFKNTHHEDSVD